MTNADAGFKGSIPEIYETHLVPLLFEPYAEDLVQRLRGRPLQRVLELAAGTGVVTRAMAKGLPKDVEIVATDLNPDMLAKGEAIGTARPVAWRTADATKLPFADASFDAVVVQFGVMFFPDRAQAYAEARRVLKPGGLFLFNVWDRLEHNDFSDVVSRSVAAAFPQDAPGFLARTPYAYHDAAAIKRDLQAGGFTVAAQIETVAHRSKASSARIPAIAICQGTPLRAEIERQSPSALQHATEVAAAAIEQRFGKGPVDGRIQAIVVAASAP